MRIIYLILTLFSCLQIYSQSSSENLLLHYKFDGDALDAGSNNYDGSISGVTFGEDRFGNPNAAAYFDGIDDFIDLPNINELKPDLPVSFSFWIKYDSDDVMDRAVFNTSFEDDRSSGVFFNAQASTGKYAINYGDGAYAYTSGTRRTYVSNQVIDMGNWHHVAVVVTDDGEMKIYVDCVEFGGEYSGSGGDLFYSNTSGSIGRSDRDLGIPPNFFKGAIDDFRYWNKALTDEEVHWYCNDDLLLHYQFDGDTVDSSDNKYDGTASGISYGPDRFGNPYAAAYFDGNDDFVDFPNINELKPDLPVSFSFWIKYDSNDVMDRAVFNTSFEDDRSSGVFFNSRASTGQYAVNYGDGSFNYTSGTRRTFVSDKVIDTEEWHHIAVVVAGSMEMKIYVDCTEYSGMYSGSGGELFYSDTAGSIGRSDRDLGVLPNYFKGAIDDFRYWKKALTEEDVYYYCDNTVLNTDEYIMTNNESIVIAPIPAREIITIETKFKNIENIRIYNSVGQLVMRRKFEPIIDVRDLSKGLYMAVFEKGSVRMTTKFIKD